MNWVPEDEIAASAAWLLGLNPEFFGVVQINVTGPRFSDTPGLLLADYGVLLHYEVQSQRIGVMLHIDDVEITYVDFLCAGPPEDFLATHSLYAGKVSLILRGPAFR